jgi:hypothetical protein
MAAPTVVLSREELYNEVWSEPIVRVAARLGLSGRGLGKRCARNHIPVPPRGWWAKKQHGHDVRRTPLPKVSKRDKFVFDPKDANRESGEECPEITREKTADWRICVLDDLGISHPLVKDAALAMRRVIRDTPKDRPVRWQDRYQAHLVKPGPGYLDIAVAKKSVPRALRIMQALMDAFARRNFNVHITDTNESHVTVMGEPLQFCLSERLANVRVERKYGRTVDVEPSGCLVLRIRSRYYGASVADRPSRPIEESLNQLVIKLVRRALQERQEREILADRQRRWEIQDEQNRLHQRVRDSEVLRQRRLRTAAIRWSDTNALLTLCGQYVSDFNTISHNPASGRMPNAG